MAATEEVSGTFLDLMAGETLLEQKKKWRYGNFEDGLKRAYGDKMPMHKAYKFMAIAERFAGRFEEVAFLSTTALHKLSSPRISDGALETILSALKAGRLSTNIDAVATVVNFIIKEGLSADEALARYLGPATPQKPAPAPVTPRPSHIDQAAWEELKELSRPPAVTHPNISYSDDVWLAENIMAEKDLRALLADDITLSEFLLEEKKKLLAKLDARITTYHNHKKGETHDNHTSHTQSATA